MATTTQPLQAYLFDRVGYPSLSCMLQSMTALYLVDGVDPDAAAAGDAPELVDALIEAWGLDRRPGGRWGDPTVQSHMERYAYSRDDLIEAMRDALAAIRAGRDPRPRHALVWLTPAARRRAICGSYH